MDSEPIQAHNLSVVTMLPLGTWKRKCYPAEEGASNFFEVSHVGSGVQRVEPFSPALANHQHGA